MKFEVCWLDKPTGRESTWKRQALTVALLCSVCLNAVAAPAPWYLWRSRLNGATFCHQTSPGEGWERIAGPFKNARCEKPASPTGEVRRLG
jgi:hypothetical protein